MNWQEKLTQLSLRRVGLLATATTGLRPEEGAEVIAVDMCAPQDDGTWGRALLVRNDIDEQKLNEAREYHKFDRMHLQSLGKSDLDFQTELRQRLADRVWFTYNVPFQQSFLLNWVDDVELADLPLLVKMADTARPQPDVYSLEELQRNAVQVLGRAPGFTWLCSNRQINPDAPPGVFPVRHAVRCLYELWQRLATQEFRE